MIDFISPPSQNSHLSPFSGVRVVLSREIQETAQTDQKGVRWKW